MFPPFCSPIFVGWLISYLAYFFSSSQFVHPSLSKKKKCFFLITGIIIIIFNSSLMYFMILPGFLSFCWTSVWIEMFILTHLAPTLVRYFGSRELSTYGSLTHTHLGGMLWMLAVSACGLCLCVSVSCMWKWNSSHFGFGCGRPGARCLGLPSPLYFSYTCKYAHQHKRAAGLA